MAKPRQRTARKPATKFAHLRKKMLAAKAGQLKSGRKRKRSRAKP